MCLQKKKKVDVGKKLNDLIHEPTKKLWTITTWPLQNNFERTVALSLTVAEHCTMICARFKIMLISNKSTQMCIA